MHVDAAIAAGKGTQLAVVESGAGQAQALPAGKQAATVVGAAQGQAQPVAADQAAGLVVQAGGGQLQDTQAGDITRAVVQGSDVGEGQGAIGGDQALPVVQVALEQVERHGTLADQRTALLDQATQAQAHVALGRDFSARAGVQGGRAQIEAGLGVDQAGFAVVDGAADRRLEGLARQQGTAGVVQRGALENEVAAALDQALAGVVQGTVDSEAEVAPGGQDAAGIGQARGVQVQAVGTDQPGQVGQDALDAQEQALVRKHAPAVVVQVCRGQGEARCAGDFPTPVTHGAEAVQQQLAGGVQQAAIVVQGTALQIQGKAVLAEQFTALLGQAGGAQQQRTAGGDTALNIGDLPGDEVEAGTADQAALAVVEGACGQFEAAGRGNLPGAVVQPGAAQQQAGVGEHASALVEQLAMGDGGQRAGTGQVAPAVVEGLGGEGQGAFAAEQSTLVEQPAVAPGIARVGGQFDDQEAVAGERAATVVQMSTGYTGLVPAIDQALVAVEQAPGGEVQVRGQQATAIAVVQRGGRE